MSDTDTSYAERVADARRLLSETSWPAMADSIARVMNEGISESNARRIIERKTINDLRRALAFLLGET